MSNYDWQKELEEKSAQGELARYITLEEARKICSYAIFKEKLDQKAQQDLIKKIRSEIEELPSLTAFEYVENGTSIRHEALDRDDVIEILDKQGGER